MTAAGGVEDGPRRCVEVPPKRGTTPPRSFAERGQVEPILRLGTVQPKNLTGQDCLTDLVWVATVQADGDAAAVIEGAATVETAVLHSGAANLDRSPFFDAEGLHFRISEARDFARGLDCKCGSLSHSTRF